MARVKDLWLTAAGERTSRHGHGKRWLAVWAAPAGETSKAFAKRADAARHGTAMEADHLRGAYIDPRAGLVTLREYALKRWLPAQVHLRPGSAEKYASVLQSRILPVFGARTMGSLARTDMKAFVGHLSAELAPASVHGIFAVLRALAVAAVDDGVIVTNPCARVPLPRLEARVAEPIAPGAVLELCDRIAPRYRVAVVLAAGAGLRLGEALGLTVPRADFLHRRLHIVEQAQRGQLAPLKTRASRRVIPADDWVLNAISDHLALYGPGPGQTIISTSHGRIGQRSGFNHYWRPAVAAAGLPEGTRFHDLRHFFASALIAANLNPKVIQSRLGHATIAETMDTYGHLFPDAEDLGRGAVEATLGSALAEQERNRSAL